MWLMPQSIVTTSARAARMVSSMINRLFQLRVEPESE